MFHFNIKYHEYSKVHFIGIGGVSMSGIAELLFNLGYEVSGSDQKENKYIRHLRDRGIKITIGQSADNITNQDLFVYTDAIPESNEELKAARATRRPVVTRGQFLGALMRNYENSIAVSGSHGKSTTTAIISKILLYGQTDPTILLGGSLDEIAGNVLQGNSEFFLAEACEYKGNIRYYYPQIAVILNINKDHLDYYKDLEDIIDAFIAYMENMSSDSTAIINIDDENCRQLLDHIQGKTVTFGIDNDQADYKASDIEFDKFGHPSFTLTFPNGEKDHYDLAIIGRYNVSNMLAAIAATDQTGVSREAIKKGVENYHPLHRRMEIVGDYEDAVVMTDYGHHPTEIKSTLEALAEQKEKNLICVFQPHTYSRTYTLMDDFAEAFYDADEVIVTKIMGAREVDTGLVKAEELVERLVENGVNAIYLEDFDDVEEYLHGKVANDDLILTTGCGNVDELAYQLAGVDDNLNELDTKNAS